MAVMSSPPSAPSPPPTAAPVKAPFSRLPFYYGWIVVAVAFVTMGVGVNARSAFSLLFPPILEEFQWSRGETAGSFAIGFLASAVMAPFIGMGIDRYGPRLIFPLGGLLVAIGLAASTYVNAVWQMFLTMGVLVVGGSVIIAYVGHSAFLPNWFVRRRGLAIGIAFSGVGLFAMILMPSLQWIIDQDGWRAACWFLAILVFCTVVPLNLLLQRKRPEDIGLNPDGDAVADAAGGNNPATDNVIDHAWVETEWTVRRAMATARFWWLAAAFLCAL
jgi:MFS family permease